MAQKKIQKVKKGPKKGFFEVVSGLTATKMQIYAGEIEELDGRTVKLDLSRNLRGKSVDLKLKISVVDGKAEAKPVEMKIVSSHIRKVMRRGIDYVEDSFIVNCRDKKAVIKPFLITRKKVSRAVRKALREMAKKYLQGYVKARTADELFSELLSGKIQKQMSLKLKKIYPLALCEIRIFEITGDTELKAEEVGEVVEDSEEEKEISK